MCLDDEENNIKRIIGKEAIASRPLSEEQNGGQPKEQNNKQNTENTADTTSQNNNTNQEDKENTENKNTRQDTQTQNTPQNEAFTPPAKISTQNDPEENQMPLLSH